jgi:hypothetical protein
MIFAQVALEDGRILGTFSFISLPRRDEFIGIAPTGRFQVVGVQHVAGDPQDNNPPAWSRLVVRPIA